MLTSLLQTTSAQQKASWVAHAHHGRLFLSRHVLCNRPLCSHSRPLNVPQLPPAVLISTSARALHDETSSGGIRGPLDNEAPKNEGPPVIIMNAIEDQKAEEPPPPSQQHRQWPEPFDEFLECLRDKGYFDLESQTWDMVRKERRLVKKALLNFSRSFPDIATRLRPDLVRIIALAQGAPDHPSERKLRSAAGRLRENYLGPAGAQSPSTQDLVRVLWAWSQHGTHTIESLTPGLPQTLGHLLDQLTQLAKDTPLASTPPPLPVPLSGPRTAGTGSDGGIRRVDKQRQRYLDRLQHLLTFRSVVAGDWVCGQCSSHNFKRNTTCIRCGVPERSLGNEVVTQADITLVAEDEKRVEEVQQQDVSRQQSQKLASSTGSHTPAAGNHTKVGGTGKQHKDASDFPDEEVGGVPTRSGRGRLFPVDEEVADSGWDGESIRMRKSDRYRLVGPGLTVDSDEDAWESIRPGADKDVGVAASSGRGPEQMGVRPSGTGHHHVASRNPGASWEEKEPKPDKEVRSQISKSRAGGGVKVDEGKEVGPSSALQSVAKMKRGRGAVGGVDAGEVTAPRRLFPKNLEEEVDLRTQDGGRRARATPGKGDDDGGDRKLRSFARPLFDVNPGGHDSSAAISVGQVVQSRPRFRTIVRQGSQITSNDDDSEGGQEISLGNDEERERRKNGGRRRRSPDMTASAKDKRSDEGPMKASRKGSSEQLNPKSKVADAKASLSWLEKIKRGVVS